MPKRTKPYLLHASIRPDVDVDFEAFPFSIPAVREIGSIDFHPNVTFFVGENGSGKSTVMEGIALALGFSAEGGTRNVRFTGSWRHCVPFTSWCKTIRNSSSRRIRRSCCRIRTPASSCSTTRA